MFYMRTYLKIEGKKRQGEIRVMANNAALSIGYEEMRLAL